MTNITLSTNMGETYSLPFANFGRRFGAAIIDLFLLSILIFFLKIAFSDFFNTVFFQKSSTLNVGNGTYWILSKGSLIGLWIVYSIIMECTVMKGTVGKQIMGIIVTDENGERISLLRSLSRNLFKIVSYAVLCLGFLNVLVDRKNRGWHDLVAKTLVIRNRP